jgi:Leucine-rich repeat (LRR) protein
LKDLDVLRHLRRKIGRPFHYVLDDEIVVELHLTSTEYVYGGLIRHHTPQEKEEILVLISGLNFLRKLDLRRCMIMSTPIQMGNLINLTHLDLGSNYLGVVPPWIERINNLKYLNLAVNKLRLLPSFLGKFDGIQTLLVHKNEVSVFPLDFSSMKNLNYLNLYQNRIKDIPSFMDNVKINKVISSLLY